MTRHVLTRADFAKAIEASRQRHHDIREAKRMRREGELALLDKLLAEAAMPEWYPER